MKHSFSSAGHGMLYTLGRLWQLMFLIREERRMHKCPHCVLGMIQCRLGDLSFHHFPLVVARQRLASNYIFTICAYLLRVLSETSMSALFSFTSESFLTSDSSF